MNITITETDDFVRTVEVVPIAAQPGNWHVKFSSQLRSANNPQEWQRNFALILGEDALRALCDLFEAQLSQSIVEIVK